jgi:DNA-binding SARP family transcriptional activator
MTTMIERAAAPARRRCEVRLLGEFVVTVDGVSIRRWQAGKARNLFQYLMLERGRAVSRETLTEALWPESDIGPESSSLRVAVHALRRILADGAPDEESTPMQLQTSNTGYRLHAGEVWVDVYKFDDAIAAATAARREGRGGVAIQRYREALSLYQGDLLPEETAPWVDLRRHGLRSAVLIALEAQLEAAMESDDGPEVVELARRTLEIEPHREEAYRALIVQHGRMGQVRQADAWFSVCSQRLGKDLDMAPADATRRVYERVARGEYLRY